MKKLEVFSKKLGGFIPVTVGAGGNCAGSKIILSDAGAPDNGGWLASGWNASKGGWTASGWSAAKSGWVASGWNASKSGWTAGGWTAGGGRWTAGGWTAGK